MRFTSVRFDGLSSALFKLRGASLADPYVITDIDGLGPTEVDVSISTSAHGEGRHSSSFSNPRQLVFSLTINPDYKSGKTVSDLREELYWLSESGYKRGVRITLVNSDKDVCSVTGYVSRFEPNIFSPETTIQITFKCLDSKLTGPEIVTHTSENSVLTVIPQGTARTQPRLYIDFIKPSTTLSVVRMINNEWEESFELTGFEYQPGDRIALGHIDGLKQVVWSRRNNDTGETQTASHIRYLSLQSKWPQLDPSGDNVLIAWGSDYLQGDVRIVQAAYRPKYRGV